ncbi:hypothetical protein A2715_05155 [Candidatus Woesebacteria bacterium RIFCSPHIGHO2_01_FULL_39_32]|uniref:Uncharacterized protein n=1 Tax=Candidatus Woesebacteria bacterium RIFCSPLOWO2_01_FULL_39_25 TaxID=1802521 RepID=A0A1F8BLI9_9BACT|nr:MAG: hypothetical protein A2124_05160 [Candidatus Woesebacteria bacterium GWB1_37_5]OGM25406.1 MAG: hypothetical protein A2715_05155 [Candidatus Woesebacteria bacterium RIFCSPHIGHO2_01_FULL_39_32]OGM38512.1 MAG: hypothetical protein A3F01_04115 [Candidatus Woesebacteria bacterium RIFCSPHIGHO2_12_FULL_38_11]OGM64937.1 MAG: hypothetical protein A2893_04765 [Candidatus Woesebacteria bacterium RIFCSPLOWO2_01_FULL_39_25]
MRSEIEWIKLVTRKNSLAFMHVVAKQKPYVKAVIDFDLNYYWYNGITYEACYSKKEVYGLGSKISDEIKKNLNFASQNAELCRVLCDKLILQSEAIGKVNLRLISNRQLYKILNDFLVPFYELVPFLLVPHSVERQILSEIEELVSQKLGGDEEKQKKIYRSIFYAN